MASKFKYIICLDFEATCWEERDSENAEIIEFGALLLNLQSGEIDSEFHEYVQPTYRPILSEYCISLTGITQVLIDAQAKYPVVYNKFVTWLEKICDVYQLKMAMPNTRTTSYGINTAFCSWTNWDLGHYLRIDCTRHGINPKPYLKTWIDARKIFERKHPGRYTFQEALDFISIKQTGNAHSAIDDARTLAKMVLNLYRSGAEFHKVTDWKNY
ncbi:ERI1 exoribonuclease 2-like [Sitodiplosis mosellana]|uniref:ERI1 exoribonuclease 2-like n=1 Tax=Sitodiplosis mosellana TaxID=263140 RepID=UPI0024448ECF|nr:ERI1 exoribonuclease 2-like [Sitodiplosis mosellana]XP_055299821.1 ERI1 exoribonuclease 2-like [Sitodiplosis mosellana]XP_055299822.1 ERI1 exoribonuclease 2-like [Sitodiplosis mosellana]